MIVHIESRFISVSESLSMVLTETLSLSRSFPQGNGNTISTYELFGLCFKNSA